MYWIGKKEMGYSYDNLRISLPSFSKYYILESKTKVIILKDVLKWIWTGILLAGED